MVRERDLYHANRLSLIHFNVTAHSDNIITIVNNEPSWLRQRLQLLNEPGLVNGYLKGLRCQADVPNLPVAIVPNIDNSATDQERLAASKQIEWESPRFVVSYFLSNKINPSNRRESGDWTWTGMHSVVNIGESFRQYDGYDFYSNNLAFGLEENNRVGICIVSTQIRTGTNSDGSPIFTTYYPRTSEPYILPANRPDLITFIAEWKQELELSLDKPNLIVYVQGGGSGTGTGTATQTPPTVTLASPAGYAGQLYASENTLLTLTVGNLTPSQPFYLSWLHGTANTIVRTDAYTATSSGTFARTIGTSELGLLAGTQDYGARAAQSTVSTDVSPKLNIRLGTINIGSDFYPQSGGNHSASVNGVIRPGSSFQWQWQKSNSATNSTFADVGTATTMTAPTSTDIFTITTPMASFTTWGMNARYRLKITRGTHVVFSNEAVAWSGSPALG